MVSGSFNLKGLSISSTVIKCPSHQECNIVCAICRSIRVETLNGTKLSISASGSNALLSSRIYCPPHNGTCSIVATGAGAGMLSNLMVYSVDGFSAPFLDLQCNYTTNISNCYSESSPPRMVCGSNYGIISETYLNSGIGDWKHVYSDNESDICNDSMADGWYGKTFDPIIWVSNIFCVDDVDCLVRCGGFKCDHSKIYGPTTGSLSVDCYDYYGCSGAIIIGPSDGELDIICNASQACYGTEITGPTNGDFDLSCSTPEQYSYREEICTYIVIDASNMINGSLNVQSTTSRSDPPIEFGTIKCPGNLNECNIFCLVASSCKGMTVLSLDDSNVFITATGSSALQQSNIHCPSNGPCVIDVVSSATYTDMLSEIQIYSPQAFVHLQLHCNYSMNIAECYGAMTKPTLSCLPKVNASCTIGLQPNTFDEWQCIDTGTNDTILHLCDTLEPSTAPTQSPSNNPTKYPTASPTLYPTKYPTINPTKYPTKYPTAIPTEYPTTIPTKMTEYPTKYPTTTDPSKYPTTNPTKYPTTDPTKYPTTNPSKYPTANPTKYPTTNPTKNPTKYPTKNPTKYPTTNPTKYLTKESEVTGKNNKNYTFSITVVTVLLLAVVFCLCLKHRAKEQAKKQREMMRIEMSQDPAFNHGPDADSNNTGNNHINLQGHHLQEAEQHQKETHDNEQEQIQDEESKVEHSFPIAFERSGDIESDEHEPGQEDSFDNMFVAKVGEDSVSESIQNETVNNVTTQGAEAQLQVSFHGTKGAYYDEYHHQIYQKKAHE
eukprot:787117_1